MSGYLDAKTHVYRHRPVVPVEQALIDEFVGPGSRALDVGTGATGRTARLLGGVGAEVHSIEINVEALLEFDRSGERGDVHLAAADMMSLPFVDEAFDVVLIGLHGSDYLIERIDRRRAFREADRVLRPGGVLIFNAFNPVGVALSPSGLSSSEFRRLRAKYLLTGRFLRGTLIDMNGLRLHQATTRRIIRDVERDTDLSCSIVTNQSGSSRSPLLVGLLAAAPYYVFVKPSGQPSS